MRDASDNGSAKAPARLLKGAALLFLGLGTSFLVWVGDKWIHYPEAQARQFGFEAPLWPALGGFVLVAMVAVGLLFWTAAQRVQRGEDLFSQRHRRRSSDESDWKEDSNGLSPR